MRHLFIVIALLTGQDILHAQSTEPAAYKPGAVWLVFTGCVEDNW